MCLGSLCGAGTLGILIPPSIIMVVYAVAAEVSIIKVFLAGFITNWIRHWPSNLTRGTQHILIISLVFQAAFLGAAIASLIRSFTTASQ